MCKVLYNCSSYSLDTRLFALLGRKYSENLETLADNLINVGIGWQIIFALIEKDIIQWYVKITKSAGWDVPPVL